MHLLVTRPESDADPMRVRLEAMGHRVSLCPLITIELAPDAAVHLDGVQALVATSRNGLDAVAEGPGLAAALPHRPERGIGLQLGPALDELVEGDASRPEGADVFRQPVLRPLGLALEGAEHPVPDDQDAAVVAIEVDLVRAVVHAVMGRRVEDVLDRRRQLPHPLCVDPELVDQADRLLQEDHPRREADDRACEAEAMRDAEQRLRAARPDASAPEALIRDDATQTRRLFAGR